jgi:carboxyl-terminal processing protease
MREADLDKHLQGKDEEADNARAKAREEARRKLEEELAQNKEPPKPLPQFGSPEDFQLQQALNQLRGLPVIASKTMSERQAEAGTDKR